MDSKRKNDFRGRIQEIDRIDACNSCDLRSRDPHNSLVKHRASGELWKTTCILLKMLTKHELVIIQSRCGWFKAPTNDAAMFNEPDKNKDDTSNLWQVNPEMVVFLLPR